MNSFGISSFDCCITWLSQVEIRLEVGPQYVVLNSHKHSEYNLIKRDIITVKEGLIIELIKDISPT